MAIRPVIEFMPEYAMRKTLLLFTYLTAVEAVVTLEADSSPDLRQLFEAEHERHQRLFAAAKGPGAAQ